MVEKLGLHAKAAAFYMMTMGTEQKDRILLAMADALEAKCADIVSANAKDVEMAEQNGVSKPMVDRLLLNEKRVGEMAQGLRDVARLADPTGVGEVFTRPNGLKIERVRVPLGVIGIIYEARPNVTADAIGLCIKSGNAVILRGGKEAINSNIAIADIMDEAAHREGLPTGAIGLIRDTSRESATRLMRMNESIDVLIPRGSASLIQSVLENATVPVIETGTGNCHIYVDVDADFDKAEKILINAKCSRPAVCNAAETLLVARAVHKEFLELIGPPLRARGVEVRGCKETLQVLSWGVPATEDDWYKEYDDNIIAVKVVGGIGEAISHINTYNTKHSEAIVTENYTTAQRFLNEIDAAALYVNASTRFTDGGEFGLGAEIGISTQKMHARGPMGLSDLTTVKYLVYGDGQIR